MRESGVVDSESALAFECVERLDAELAKVARSAGSLRLHLADGLEALVCVDGHHEMGFATMEAYALERCERSARWVQQSRWLSRRMKELLQVRRALVQGKLSFSMVQVIAKVASSDNEEQWLSEANGRTVRAMRLLVKQRLEATGQMSAVGAEQSVATDGQMSAVDGAVADCEPKATLTLTMDQEDAWLFECARMIVGRVAGGPLEETVDALLAEGVTTLLPRIDETAIAITSLDALADDRAALRAWELELAGFREEAEIRCEAALAERASSGGNSTDARVKTESDERAMEWQGNGEAIDAELRRIAAELAQRELWLGELAERFWNADGWRRLGYATESQYTWERLEMSLSSVKAKRALAQRAKALPSLREAMQPGKLGYEAGRLVGVVATNETAEAWVERARERTIRHLREEVDAAQMLARLGIDAGAHPPDETVMEELAGIERRVVTGAVFESAGEGQMSAGAETAPEVGRQRGRERSLGRVTVRLRVSTGTLHYFRWLERDFLRSGPRGVSFMRFLCLALIDAWKHALGSSEAYAHVYARDRFRCTNPVCGRRDLTPHHLIFRSAGGDDTDENVASLCVWCHLDGVHEGRLAVTPPASAMEWRIGRVGQIVVKGRRRLSETATEDRGKFDLDQSDADRAAT